MAPSLLDKQSQVVFFSATAIALYGYDQGMMSLINTNNDYLSTMGIAEEDPLVGVIVAVYYLGCTVGAILASWLSNTHGRKLSIIVCLTTASIGNLIMFLAGYNGMSGAIYVMLIGRIVMGLGLSEDDARGTALAQEFQANIFGLNMAFIVNLALTHNLGKFNQWAWRSPIIIMQVFPAVMMAVAGLLPETPRWYVLHEKPEKAEKSIAKVWGQDAVDERIKSLKEAHEKELEDGSGKLTYADLCLPGRDQFHPTVITVMGQVNQALTGYGAVSVYGPQIFELLGFQVTDAEYLTMGNYLFYFGMMTLAWILIDRKGRRWLLVSGSFWLAVSFALLTLLGGLASNRGSLGIPLLATGVPGIITLYLATAAFGICWLTPPFLIPTEIYPSSCRAQGSAISVIIWGLANFTITLLTPIGFNNLEYWLFAAFAVTNGFAGVWTWAYIPESGHRSFEENQKFFEEAEKEGSWRVGRVKGGEWRNLPNGGGGEGDEEEQDGGGARKKNGNGGDERRHCWGGGTAIDRGSVVVQAMSPLEAWNLSYGIT
ncbi:Sugar transporter STL1 [Cyphellophora attinorum]|uniref:Sugar transporter STL1 n=1 Tax=Cyphellophora attinorum TaxID=1664694 RepID=A0A0N1NX42_9EURO|nr:Sugar transporter STL1 [Phialophora attinorum]KPI34302.1 Sugar transporter STL1 [Phialophora attinorum]